VVKKHHKTYNLKDLREGNTRMVDPNVNPNKNEYSDEFELGIDRHAGKRRWTIDTYKEREHKHQTPKMKKSELKELIKESIRVSLQESSVERLRLQDKANPELPVQTHHVIEVLDLNNITDEEKQKLKDLTKERDNQVKHRDLSTDRMTSSSVPVESEINQFKNELRKKYKTRELKPIRVDQVARTLLGRGGRSQHMGFIIDMVMKKSDSDKRREYSDDFYRKLEAKLIRNEKNLSNPEFQKSYIEKLKNFHKDILGKAKDKINSGELQGIYPRNIYNSAKSEFNKL